MYDDNYVKLVQFVAKGWSKTSIGEPVNDEPSGLMKGPDAIGELQRRWTALVNSLEEIQPCESSKPQPTWCDDAMWLLAVADEASAGIGFFRPKDETDSDKAEPFVDYWIRQYIIWDIILYLREKSVDAIQADEKVVLRENLVKLFGLDNHCLTLVDDPIKLKENLKETIELKQLSNSLCMMVPRIQACVQPKTRTSGVGCTLRSLSHHLALLPPASQVETRWRVSNNYLAHSKDEAGPQALNLLLVPFPFTIQGTCFEGGKACAGSHRGDWDDDGVNRSRFFKIKQNWLNHAQNPKIKVSASDIASFLIELISIAKFEIDQVHGLILPELALTNDLAEEVAEILSKKTNLELFISGVLTGPREDRGPKNSVYTCVFKGGDSPHLTWSNRSWTQAKHHRWKVEKHQIRRYHLGGRLDPHIDWWEHIDISPRQCFFGALRHEACVTALICEDLARIDPVQTAIRSIGPNLVVALLMDGPQMESRWSGRYATVLADDPGSAVLTLTSLGLLNRSAEPGKPFSGQIALWKDAGGEKATELIIPNDHHGLLLTLSYKRETTYTMDGRPDITKTVSLTRSGYHPIKHPLKPPWLS